MVRFPEGWTRGIAAIPASMVPYALPSVRPIRRTRQERFTGHVKGVPLTGGQGVVIISGAGTGTVTLTPQGLGTVWYPAAVNISTTTGAADASTAQVFLGATGIDTLLVGQSYAAGGDTISLSVPPLRPGENLIVMWSGAHAGDTASVNILGLMDALLAG